MVSFQCVVPCGPDGAWNYKDCTMNMQGAQTHSDDWGKNTAGKQPHNLLPLSQVTQPPGSQKALLHLETCSQEAFPACMCPLNMQHASNLSDYLNDLKLLISHPLGEQGG